MNQLERETFQNPLNLISKASYESRITFESSHLYSNPVKNSDLPNLRASFIKNRLEKSGSTMQLKVGVINGEVIRTYNPLDRCVVIYLLQTKVDLTQIPELAPYFAK